MLIKVKKISRLSTIPKYAHSGDAGLDLYSIEEITIPSGETQLIRTGICIELPKNTEAQIRPRSGLALNHSVTVLNTPGTIDEGYRGEIGIILINHGHSPFHVQVKSKIAQLVVKPTMKVEVEEVEELAYSPRANNGFGSTGY